MARFRGHHDGVEHDRRQIVAFGGGGFSMESGNPLLDDYVLGLCEPPRPRVCFLPTASGDADHYVVRFYRAFPADRCEASHVSLFRREQGPGDLRAHLLSQDLIYVGGGSVLSLLGVWRAHGIDRILADAWRAGVILCGLSAGSLCWFEAGTTDSFGPQLAPFTDGLGFIPGSHAPHYDGEPNRRPHYQRLVAEGVLPAGYAADDGAALVFHGTEVAEVVASRPDARGYRVERAATGDVVETELPTRYLG